MELIKHILNGQKLFFSDVFAVVDLVVLSLAYILGVGVSRIFLRKKTETHNYKSNWSASDLTKKERESFLKQF